MKLFKGLALFAAIEATCPTQWLLSDGNCVPAGPWSTTCNTNGTMTITAHINHFYEKVPSNIQSNLIGALKSSDSWGAVDGEAEQLAKEVTLAYDMTNVEGTDYIRGKYTFGPSVTAAEAAEATIGTISLDLATPLSYDVECLWEADFSYNIETDVVIADSGTTFDQGTASKADLDVTLSLSGGTNNEWMLGDKVTIEYSNNLVGDLGTSVNIAILGCRAYSDSIYSSNEVTISHGTCGASAINAATTVTGANLVNTVSFDAFKYASNGAGDLDAVAYISCNLRVCLKTDSGCAGIISSNQADASGNGDVSCD